MRTEAGQTTTQMLRAPRGSLYLWPAMGSISYAQHLAQHLGRGDLVIVSVEQVMSDPRISRWGDQVPAIVVDHSVTMGTRLCLMLDGLWSQVAR